MHSGLQLTSIIPVRSLNFHIHSVKIPSILFFFLVILHKTSDSIAGGVVQLEERVWAVWSASNHRVEVTEEFKLDAN